MLCKVYGVETAKILVGHQNIAITRSIDSVIRRALLIRLVRGTSLSLHYSFSEFRGSP